MSDFVDKARAWDAITAKNRIITDLTAALQAYIDHCPDCGRDERSPDKCQRCENAMRAIERAKG